MDLINEEIRAIKSQNQRVKALGSGTVTTIWKDGKIEKIFVEAEVSHDIYSNLEIKNIDTNPP